MITGTPSRCLIGALAHGAHHAELGDHRKGDHEEGIDRGCSAGEESCHEHKRLAQGKGKPETCYVASENDD